MAGFEEPLATLHFQPNYWKKALAASLVFMNWQDKKSAQLYASRGFQLGDE
jgi:hypothetical protein